MGKEAVSASKGRLSRDLMEPSVSMCSLNQGEHLPEPGSTDQTVLARCRRHEANARQTQVLAEDVHNVLCKHRAENTSGGATRRGSVAGGCGDFPDCAPQQTSLRGQRSWCTLRKKECNRASFDGCGACVRHRGNGLNMDIPRKFQNVASFSPPRQREDHLYHTYYNAALVSAKVA